MTRHIIPSLLIVTMLASAFTAVALTAEASAATLQSPVQIYNETPQIEGNAELGVETPSPSPTATPIPVQQQQQDVQQGDIAVKKQELNDLGVGMRGGPGGPAAQDLSPTPSAAAAALSPGLVAFALSWYFWGLIIAILIIIAIVLMILRGNRPPPHGESVLMAKKRKVGSP
jgi:hypothetical protein